jgi:hypothetical protein
VVGVVIADHATRCRSVPVWVAQHTISARVQPRVLIVEAAAVHGSESTVIVQHLDIGFRVVLVLDDQGWRRREPPSPSSASVLTIGGLPSLFDLVRAAMVVISSAVGVRRPRSIDRP